MSLRWTILAAAYDRMASKSEEAGVAEMRRSLRPLSIGRATSPL